MKTATIVKKASDSAEANGKGCLLCSNGVCHALFCYSPENCGGRDRNGNPVFRKGPSVRVMSVLSY